MNNNAELPLKSCDELLMNEYEIYRERGSVQFGIILSSSFSRYVFMLSVETERFAMEILHRVMHVVCNLNSYTGVC